MKYLEISIVVEANHEDLERVKKATEARWLNPQRSNGHVEVRIFDEEDFEKALKEE